ncbi:kinase-like domain-containing protein [Aspergillus crustosus]
MEYLDGRVFTDPFMPGVSPADRNEMWRSAIQTLINLHSLSPTSLNLSNLSKQTGFYNRQIKTFTSLSRHQAQTLDIETRQPIGPLPHLEETSAFFRTNQPVDRTTLVHGDYKIDNIVFHKTEPRVIGVLDWEMATLGHPLSDFVSLVAPFLPHTWASSPPPTNPNLDLNLNLPTLTECLYLYASSGYDARGDLTWGRAFAGFRGAVIMQGIAARYARRQASSAGAKEFGSMAWPTAEGVWGLVTEMKERDTFKEKGRL